ncbi:MAG: sce7725 family protein [Candidatus Hydrogenedentes bacterium]|nr:sce7725 family protein [Candidatus Hydrogenedentota bacterium]
MYRPYFRGKQFELIAIRERAGLFAECGFVPIIEPVKESIAGLTKTLDAIRDAEGRAILIVNPYHGDHSGGDAISTILREVYNKDDFVSAGVLLRSEMALNEALAVCKSHAAHDLTIIHAGFTDPKGLAAHLSAENVAVSEHIFIDKFTGHLYRRHFTGPTRILVGDGFERRRNADYPETEEFSELHVTYSELKMDGFGDFLIVGDDYSETGGPAYAVAIHLTFIDDEKDDVMYVYHFVSDTNDTPTDPAGKFAQALRKLVLKLDSGASKLYDTTAIEEFRALHDKGHFPGLGYVKKLSMIHHLETLATFLRLKPEGRE